MVDAICAEDDGAVIGYMRAVACEHEIGAASGGSRVFPSIEDANEFLPCAEGCGIVEVEVRFRKLVQQGTGETAPV